LIHPVLPRCPYQCSCQCPCQCPWGSSYQPLTNTSDACGTRSRLRNLDTFSSHFRRFICKMLALLVRIYCGCVAMPSVHLQTNAFTILIGCQVIEACDYDGPGDALQHIYAESRLTRPANLSAFPSENLVPFDQRPFFSEDNNGTATWNATTPRSTGLAPQGMLCVKIHHCSCAAAT